MSYVKLRLLFIWLVLNFSAESFAAEMPFYCDGSLTYPCLVQESLSQLTPVSHLRSPALIQSYYDGNVEGLDALKLTASAMPNAMGWDEIREYIYQLGMNPKKTIVVDLRQESHGYLNGMAITLSTTHNWINLDKTNEEAKLAERYWLNLLKNQLIASVLTPQQFETNNYLQPININIQTIQSEKEVVKQHGFDYERFYVSDHRAPIDTEVNRFVEFYRHLPADTWLHIHCRGGKGRTTSFMAIIDMLHNADKVSFEEIISRQASIPPFYNLAMIVRSDPDLTPFYIERFQFLQQFYHFAKASLQGYQGTWLEWRQVN
ncbi:phosphatase domain-containing putative toxin [Legionella hackeliae]|uniref:Tyrosine phosphatase II superfamily protein n=1 Tax=Legionella hackeliae TaxID=449 RepID=A0A0A8UU12_LEGHA|nr:hypothetical protein [Legionella hackeliae]KTD13871.1 tyrosine phosphatase II superfamily transporter protein [Legionella hackeliae]CEK10572.1 Tyrosine phosphatase II superfamily protein [Legionella hackeliae]STX47312.1 tyrosine phosphatase II superfamily protein [Legionella hackeliae]